MDLERCTAPHHRRALPHALVDSQLMHYLQPLTDGVRGGVLRSLAFCSHLEAEEWTSPCGGAQGGALATALRKALHLKTLFLKAVARPACGRRRCARAEQPPDEPDDDD